MKDSEIVISLANVASQGKYNITIADAQKMTALYERVATLINKLEAAEAEADFLDIEESATRLENMGVRDVVEAEAEAPLPIEIPSPAVAEATSPVEVSPPIGRTALAILDFKGIGVSAQEAQLLTIRLGTHLVQSGVYRVIERDEIQQILVEQDFQLAGCTTNECAVEIGQLVNAQQMLAGTFGKLGSTYTIDMRIIDVATGDILRTTSVDSRGEIDLVLSEGLAEAVRRIIGSD